MSFAFEKLKGLDRDSLLEVIEPVLNAHRVKGVELIWRTDNRGWVLYLTVERPGPAQLGAGVTLDECSEVARDLSAALDVANLIEPAYRLEVGTPGLERQLYQLDDYLRFAGQPVRLKVKEPVGGQYRLRGTLLELDEQGRLQIDTDSGIFALPFESIEQGQLVFEVPSAARPKHSPSKKKAANKGAADRSVAAKTSGRK